VVASKTCLVRYDYNRYSVAARAAGRHVQLRAYADRIAVFLNGEIVAEHARCFGRYKTIFNAWHYLPVLARKPGTLRNGEPFRDWDLPCGLAQIRERLRAHADGDRQFVAVLSAVSEAACTVKRPPDSSTIRARRMCLNGRNQSLAQTVRSALGASSSSAQIV